MLFSLIPCFQLDKLNTNSLSHWIMAIFDNERRAGPNNSRADATQAVAAKAAQECSAQRKLWKEVENRRAPAGRKNSGLAHSVCGFHQFQNGTTPPVTPMFSRFCV
jgi:hypothetical protein